jgi:Zn-dependent protease
MAFLQLTAAAFNLCPVPPLDGFQTIAPWLPHDFRMKVSMPPMSTYLMIGFFIAVWHLPVLPFIQQYLLNPLLNGLGYGDTTDFFTTALRAALFSRS